MKEALLSVDLEAALAKLALGRLPGPEHAAVALVRWAAAAHPAWLGLRVERRRLVLEHDGAPPRAEELETLGRALDPAVPEEVRQRALDELEARGLLDLLVAFVLPAREASLIAGGRALRSGGRPRAVRLAVETGREGVRLCLEGLQLDTAGWARTAATHLAHASFRAEIDGRQVTGGLVLHEVLHAATTRRGELLAVVGLPRQGHAARTRVLERGVLRREVWASPPGGEVWDALVDGPPNLEREALALAAECATRLLHEARGSFTRLPPADQRRLAELLFRLADAGQGASAAAGVPLFRGLDGAAYRPEELPALARKGSLRAVGPEARPEQHLLEGVVLVLDEAERAFVERHLGLAVHEPARRPMPPGLGRRLRRALAERLGRLGHALRRRLLLQRAVPAAALDPAEAALASALERALAAGLVPGREGARVRFCQGRLVASTWEGGRGGQVLWLGRRHPRVRGLLAAWRREPRALYAVLMLLQDGADAFGARRAEAVARLAGLE